MPRVADLSTIELPSLPPALAVGWLGETEDYPKGPIDRRAFDALFALCVDAWQPWTTAGFHRCTLCQFTGGPSAVSHEGGLVRIGTTNVFVPFEETLYVAPSHVLHYIDAHRYRPPDVFLEAVVACPPMRSMEYWRALRRAGVTVRRP